MLKDLVDPGAVARWAALMYPSMRKPAEPGKERLHAYFLALGRFADTFAHTELLTHFVLRWHTRTSSDIARAVFSGVRTKEALGYFRRLSDVGAIRTGEWVELLPLVEQLGGIADRRNDILHHGASDIAAGGGVVSNDAMALTPGRAHISPEILDDMTADLQKINVHFLLRHMGRQALRGKHPELDAVLDRAWRYKLPQRPQRQTNRIAKTGKRQRPPKSSSA
jgi:hypothetical protein